jgi:hypothetical protein
MEKGADDPRQEGPAPPFSQPAQEHPGTEAQMTPDADHGEHDYRGANKVA